MIYSTDRENSQFRLVLGGQRELGAYWMRGGQTAEEDDWRLAPSCRDLGAVDCVCPGSQCWGPAKEGSGVNWPLLGRQGDLCVAWEAPEGWPGSLRPSQSDGSGTSLAVSKRLLMVGIAVAVYSFNEYLLRTYCAPRPSVTQDIGPDRISHWFP